MKQQTSLSGKQVLILGGSSGIGLATAKEAAEEGALVTIVASRQNRMDEALQQLPENAKGLIADLSTEAGVQQLFENIGQIDHLVYTAGENIKTGLVADLNIDDARDYFNIRYWGAVAAVKYGTAHINQGGSIVLSSGSASRRTPMAGWGMGASICAAMEGFTRAMAVELSPLRVNVVVPGFVKTPLWDSVPEDAREAMYQSAAEALLVKHVATPDEIAEAYLYLMKATYSTGQCVVIDGGGALV